TLRKEGHSMKRFQVITAALAALFGASVASAQVVPPPAAATIVNFDDIPGAQDVFSIAGPISTGYGDRGLTFQGFGTHGGAVLGTGPGLPNPEIPPPNFLVFVSAFSMQNGGLIQSPETLTFYPPVTHFQFDTGTLGFECNDTMVLHITSFDANGDQIQEGDF